MSNYLPRKVELVDTEYPKSNRFKDLTGLVVNKLKVISYAGKSASGQVYWHCQCECGNEKDIAANNLTKGVVKSCGCEWKAMVDSKRNAKYFPRTVKHGMHKTKIYRAWKHMKERCYNPNNSRFSHYGGRGIFVCDEWLDKENGFINFYNWSVENGYDEENKTLSIDRIDNDGPYCPENCRWVDSYIQNNNKSDNTYITIGEYSYTISEWARILNLPPHILIGRIYTLNWSYEDAIFTPYKGERGKEFVIPAISKDMIEKNHYNQLQ